MRNSRACLFHHLRDFQGDPLLSQATAFRKSASCQQRPTDFTTTLTSGGIGKATPKRCFLKELLLETFEYIKTSILDIWTGGFLLLLMRGVRYTITTPTRCSTSKPTAIYPWDERSIRQKSLCPLEGSKHSKRLRTWQPRKSFTQRSVYRKTPRK